jgi:alpha-N-arabinofuranosidase
VFGGFLEHLGRAVYGGVYDPTSTHADADGMRTDVMDALRPLRMTTMRYPGGNFVSGYHWQDGVGPRDQRPTVRDLAWNTNETNQFGSDEFMVLCRKMDWEPMIAVNMGTGTPEEARNWVEYCNSPAGTQYADMRVANGHKQPYGVKLWCLGNELDGPWQLGHVPAEQYALRAEQAAKLMKLIDPSVELVACGSSGLMPTFPQWDREVLEYIGDYADFISLHRYVDNPDENTSDYLAVTNSIDQQIETIDAVCRYVQSRRGSPKRTFLSFDEWNVWFQERGRRRRPERDEHGVRFYYTLEDALVVAGFLHSFIRHADVVKAASLAQIVNVIAPILTFGDDLLVQSIYYPFRMFSERRDGVALQIGVDGPGYESPSYGYVDMVDASAIHDGNRLHVFLTNRSPDETAEVQVELTGATIEGLENAEIVAGAHATAYNTLDDREAVRAQEFSDVRVEKGTAVCQSPPLSFAALTFELE